MKSVNEIATDWIEVTLAYPAHVSEEIENTMYYVSEICEKDPELAFDFIMEVIEKYSEEITSQEDGRLSRVINNLAAGPIEDLLVYNGSSIIEKIDEEVKRSPLLRTALRGVWRNNIEQNVWDRLQIILN